MCIIIIIFFLLLLLYLSLHFVFCSSPNLRRITHTKNISKWAKTDSKMSNKKKKGEWCIDKTAVCILRERTKISGRKQREIYALCCTAHTIFLARCYDTEKKNPLALWNIGERDRRNKCNIAKSSAILCACLFCGPAKWYRDSNANVTAFVPNLCVLCGKFYKKNIN